MSYRRVLVVTELGADARAALASVRGIAPDVERLVVVVCPPASLVGVAATGGAERETVSRTSLEALRTEAATVATEVEVGVVPALDLEPLAEVVAASAIELVVAGPRPLEAIPVLAALRRRRPVAVLWIGAEVAPRREGPFAELLCVALGERARATVATFLRDHGRTARRATVYSLQRASPRELAAALEVAGVRVPVELVGPPGLSPWQAMDDLAARGRAVDLVVLARFPRLLLGRLRGPAPILVLPPLEVADRPAMQRPLDVPDVIEVDGALRLRVAHAFGVGRNPPIEDQDLALVARGRVVTVVRTHDGEAALPPGLAAGSLGVCRAGGAGEGTASAADAVSAIERLVTIVRPGALPLVLFDAELPDDDLAAVAAAGAGAELLAVRLRPSRSCHLLRARQLEAGLPPMVVDASAVLDEGPAVDVSDAFDAVRLARVGARLLAAGYPVAAVVHRAPHSPAAAGFAALRAPELGSHPLALPALARTEPASLSGRLAAMGASPTAGNSVELELDNLTARGWLLAAIGAARRRVHLQVYMVTDDAVGRAVEATLAAAAKRGVAVRVLVDSLHALHGSFGMRNPLLERLGACDGIEVRASRPLAGVPSLEELKQRDHRKLVVVDGELALIGGRNLAHEYYTAFDEVALTGSTPWREVPWLDAGARVQGPAVAAVETAFLEAWTSAGGAPFVVGEPAPVGATPARVVVHHGLRDARTLETYLAMVETARSHVYAVNGFPLVLELQHALVRAARRGVRVRALFGHVVPTHGGEPFDGDWAVARTAATWLVHSRMDALVAAGAEGYLLAVRDLPGWAPDLGLVHPHVHAKAMTADGRVCAVGSANLDVTASYWESELLLVVEDASVTAAFESRVDALIAGSLRVDPHDPEWQRIARRREWLRSWPGVLSL